MYEINTYIFYLLIYQLIINVSETVNENKMNYEPSNEVENQVDILDKRAKRGDKCLIFRK